MIKAISALEELQRVDLEIEAIREEEQGYQSSIERLAGELASVEQELERIAPDLETLDQRIAEYKDLILANEEKAKKDEGRIGDVKNEKELNALNKAIRAANKAKRQYEEELGNVSSRAEELRAKVEEKTSSSLEKKAEAARLAGEAEARGPEWKARVEEKQRRSEELKSSIRPDILRKYEAIKRQRGGRGVVPVRNEICQGCFINIPPQAYIELRKGTEELVLCPHCHRILYFESEDEPQPPGQ